MSNRKNTGSFSGKGYYIALILCAVAIGISGYLYYRNTNKPDTQLQVPTEDVGVMNPSGDDQQVVATQPTSGQSSTQPQQTQQPLKTGMPVEGKTITEHAMDCLTYNETTRDWRVHNGIDIAAEAGTKVSAAAAGTVYTVYADDALGTTVVLRHENGYVTMYSSLNSEVSVKVGDTVTLGQTLGIVDNTALLENAIGDHLHFAVTCNDAPMDPEKFLGIS